MQKKLFFVNVYGIGLATVFSITIIGLLINLHKKCRG